MTQRSIGVFPVAVSAALLWAGCSTKGDDKVASPPSPAVPAGSSSPMPAPPDAAVAMPVVPLTFPDGTRIMVEVAANDKDREYGLMNRTSLPPDYGMLFVFARDQMLQFWMKNTLVDLDMAFIGADKKIRDLFQDVPRSAVDTPEADVARRAGTGRFVLELPAGAAKRHNLGRGQTLSFDVPIPPK